MFSQLDGVLKEADFTNLVRFVKDIGWQYKWDPKLSDEPPFFNVNFTKTPVHKNSDVEYRLQGLHCLSDLWSKIKSIVLNDKAEIRGCEISLYMKGVDPVLHIGDKDGYNLTCIYFAMPMWSSRWGGQFSLYQNPDLDEPTKVVTPVPNSLFLYNSDTPHLILPISQSSSSPLVTITFKVMYRGNDLS